VFGVFTFCIAIPTLADHFQAQFLSTNSLQHLLQDSTRSRTMSAGVGFTTPEAVVEDDPTTFESSASSEVDVKQDTKDVFQQEVQQDREVHELVRKFTSQSEQHNIGSPFAKDVHHRLDPNGADFSARDWAKSFYNLRYSSEDVISRVAGVAFKGLNVWGKGSPTDFQSTVGNTILKLPSIFGRGSQKIEILRDLDGLVLPGEQLCVLGPPGYVSYSGKSQCLTDLD
jgi:hypothetical protein